MLNKYIVLWSYCVVLYSYCVVRTHVVLSCCAVNRARCGGRVVCVGKYACYNVSFVTNHFVNHSISVTVTTQILFIQ